MADKTIVLIPAFEPDHRLLELIGDLRALFAPVICVVNDGSSPEKLGIFQRLETEYGVAVLSHEINRGKGAALKTGASFISETFPGRGFVTVDADYQHLPADIRDVAEALTENPDALVLGMRNFGGDAEHPVPFRSKLGNALSAMAFRAVTGVQCEDTQTGLRGIPACFIDRFLNIRGERFEYEMAALFEAVTRLPLVRVPIATVYEDGNKSTHFKPFRDSWLIFQVFLNFRRNAPTTAKRAS